MPAKSEKQLPFGLMSENIRIRNTLPSKWKWIQKEWVPSEKILLSYIMSFF
jgi:hypothetical protein